MQTWDENQLAAWTMFGATSVTLGFFWLQHYYYKFWYGSKSEYAVTAEDDNIIRMNNYTVWGISENVNAIFMLFQWVPTAIVWVLTAGTNDDGVIWFFVVWCGIMHYIDMVRFVVVNIIKLVSLFHDTEMLITSFSGLNHSYKVSKDHELQYWDFAMEWFGFLVSYSMYLDLHTIIEDQEYRNKIRIAREQAMNENAPAGPASPTEGNSQAGGNNRF